MTSKTWKDLIDLAISKEMESHDMYLYLAGLIDDEDAKETMLLLAQEELEHKKFLEDYCQGKIEDSLEITDVVDYKIAENTEKPTISKESDIKDMYLFVAHAELDAYNFYMDLAGAHEAGKAKDLLLKIANEEQKHKEKVEYYYSNSAFPQNAGG